METKCYTAVFLGFFFRVRETAGFLTQCASLSTHLSRIQHRAARVRVGKEEHIYEMDQEAWRMLRSVCIVGRPLVEDEDDQVAKQRGHEDYLRDKSEVDVQGLLEIANKEEG